MPEKYLIVSTAGLLFVLNARRALHFPPLLIPSFFASWLTIELAPHWLVIHVLVVAFFVIEGGLRAWPGWVALGMSLAIGVQLSMFVRESYRVEKRIDDVLTEAIGPAAAHKPLAWREFAFPFKLWSCRIRRIRNVAYTSSNSRRLQLDVWYEGNGKTARPCLLYVPGGGWLVGLTNKNHQAKPLLIEMASSGWVCFSMNYPVSPRARFPAHEIAVKRAIAWIREHAHEYGGDARFLMISGNSAGGHLASLAALTPNDPVYQPGFEGADTKIQAAAPFYGVYDFTGAQMDELSRRARREKKSEIRFLERTVVQGRITEQREIFERGSPWYRVGPHAPPFFVIHGSIDTLALVEEARGFVQRLREVSKEPVIYAELPGAQHAFDHFLSIRTVYAVRAIARFGDWAWQRWKRGLSADERRDRSESPATRSPTSPA